MLSTVVELPFRVSVPLVPTCPCPVVGYDTAALLPLKLMLESAKAAILKMAFCRISAFTTRVVCLVPNEAVPVDSTLQISESAAGRVAVQL
jgi:hypothetical protein